MIDHQGWEGTPSENENFHAFQLMYQLFWWFLDRILDLVPDMMKVDIMELSKQYFEDYMTQLEDNISEFKKKDFES